MSEALHFQNGYDMAVHLHYSNQKPVLTLTSDIYVTKPPPSIWKYFVPFIILNAIFFWISLGIVWSIVLDVVVVIGGCICYSIESEDSGSRFNTSIQSLFYSDFQVQSSYNGNFKSMFLPSSKEGKPLLSNVKVDRLDKGGYITLESADKTSLIIGYFKDPDAALGKIVRAFHFKK
jgi:hypothetical protein